MTAGVRRIIPLTLGWADLPRSVSVESVAQIRKLKRIAAEQGYRLVPGHDPDAWPALTTELATPGPAQV